MSVQFHCGKWQARVRKKGYPQQTKSFTYKADAEAWEHRTLVELERGTYATSREVDRTTLGELLQRYLEECVPQQAGVERESNRVKALMRRELAQRYASTIRSADIANFVKERVAEGVSGNTVRLDIGVISRAYNRARAEWGMETLANPTTHVRLPPCAERTRRLTTEEETELLAAASAKLRPCISWALETAMRRTEIASMDWQNVDIARRTALLPKTKNGEQRTVPLSPRALEILQTLGPRKAGSVFEMTAGAITQAMDAACKKAGINDLRFHDLRHEATSRLFENTDLDVMEIRMITGHKSMQMLARYSHLRADRLADRLAGAKRGNTEEGS